LISISLLAFAAGCTAPGSVELEICPGKTSREEALAALNSRIGDAEPIRVSGEARLTYHIPGEDRAERHPMPLSLWFQPPAKIYIQGSIGVDPKALIIGSNEQEFWLAMKPKEVNSYYWGTWDDAQDFQGLMMSPKVVLEAFGIVEMSQVDPNLGAWALTNEGPFDILTLNDAQERLLKRVYIYACDYLVRKVQYFGVDGEIVATVQLDDYRVVGERFQVPTRIYLTAAGADDREDSLYIDLGTPRVRELSPRAQQRVFVRAGDEMERFEHVYRHITGQWIEER
jgi:hypothetical protein